MQVLLATPSGERVYWEVDWALPTALILGGEAKGAGETTSGWTTGNVAIPMSGGVESLNVGSAAAILLFEAARQRRVSG
jgi:TrmH family RNA methyltransferase